MGPSGYSRNLPRGRNVAQLWPQVVPLSSLGWLAQHLWQESLAPSQGSVEVAMCMDSGGPLVTVESCHTTYQQHDLRPSLDLSFFICIVGLLTVFTPWDLNPCKMLRTVSFS